MDLKRALLIVGIGIAAWAYAPRVDLEAGHFLKAQAEAEAELKANPSNALAWAAKSQTLSSFQRFAEATVAAEKALALNPNLPDAYQARGLARAGTALQQRDFSSLRSANRALSDLETAVKLDPTLVTSWMSLGLAYQALPGLLGGSTRKALRCAEQLRRVNAPKGDALQGTILAMDGRWKEAEPHFARALAAAPSDPDVVVGYLEALGSKETRKSLGSLEQRRRLASEGRRVLTSVRASGRGTEAVSDALLNANLPEEAWTVAQEGLTEVDAPSLLHLQLGKVAARAGIHRLEALEALTQLFREPLEGGSGGLVTAHWRKGQILRDLGKMAEARTEAQAALRLDPNHRGSRELLEDLTTS